MTQEQISLPGEPLGVKVSYDLERAVKQYSKEMIGLDGQEKPSTIVSKREK